MPAFAQTGPLRARVQAARAAVARHRHRGAGGRACSWSCSCSGSPARGRGRRQRARPNGSERRCARATAARRSARAIAGKPATSGGAAVPQRRNVALTVVAARSVWVCLVDADGQAPGRGAHARRAATREGPFRSKRFRITVGNGGGDLRVNGKLRDVPDRAVPQGYAVSAAGVQPPRRAAATDLRGGQDRARPGARDGSGLSVRAGIVVTGTEVLSGQVRDRNSPWLSERLAELGIELAHVVTCGDRPADLMAALEFMRDEKVDLIVTSGGLGPTADDLTAQVVGEFAGRELVLDEALEQRIAADPRALLAPLEARPGGAAGRQPQAGDGARGRRRARSRSARRPASSCRPTARSSWCCRGRRASCRRAGSRRSRPSRSQPALGGATDYRQRMLRLFGIPESEIAETLRVAEQEVDLSRPRDHHLPAPGRARGRDPQRAPRARRPRWRWSTASPSGTRTRSSRRDGSTIDEQVAALLQGPPRWRWGSRAPAGCWRRA